MAKQKELEATAQKEEALTGEYIRPVVLFQAQNESKTQENITAERLVQSLVDDFSIPRDQIAIATGKTDELLGQPILQRTCPLRFVVTVQKLKEGWDCPFAYVLCSVTNLSSKTAVEQILGRILRLPQAVLKQHTSLNFGYAYATSQNLLDAARDLSDAIVEAGFTAFEARQMIRPEDEEEGVLFAQFTDEPLVEKVQEIPDLTVLPLEVAAKVRLNEGKKLLTWTAPKAMTEPEKTALQTAVRSEGDKLAIEKLYRKSRGMATSPSAMGTLFQVPVLAIRNGEQYEMFEDQFNEGEWHLSKCDPVLIEKEFALPTGGNRAAMLDVNEKGKLTTSFIEDIQRQLEMFEQGPKDAVALTTWLSRYVKAIDVTHEEKSLFLHQLIKAAIDLRGFTIEQLLSPRFRLVDSALNKIDAHRRAARATEYQRFLSPDCATPIEVTPAKVFQYPRGAYPANQYYQGRYQFDKHYYEKPADMNDEEADCAALIDGHPKVKHWVRNLVRDNYAFALRLPHGYFFPDFVAELTDGRYLVVEYKGKQEEDRDLTRMKEVAGKLWQGRSKGLCLFFIATKENMRAQLDSVR